MTIREQLRTLIEQLDDTHAAEALAYVRWLLAEEDDEPLSPEELAQLEASRRRDPGEFTRWETVKKNLKR
jgi:hypothetical protein